MFNFEYDNQKCCFKKPDKGILSDVMYSSYMLHYGIANSKLEKIKEKNDITGKKFVYHFWTQTVKEV